MNGVNSNRINSTTSRNTPYREVHDAVARWVITVTSHVGVLFKFIVMNEPEVVSHFMGHDSRAGRRHRVMILGNRKYLTRSKNVQLKAI